jgi:prepilin-type N-terminal cleavage/methylation domain-containing protein
MVKIFDKKRASKGFTLIELLISIVLFMMFLGIVSQSYLSIVRSQRQANEVRKMYSDVRGFMDFMSEEIRLSAVDYGCYPGMNYGQMLKLAEDFSANDKYCGGSLPTIVNGVTSDLILLKKGGQEKVIVKWDDVLGKVKMSKYRKTDFGSFEPTPGYENVELFSDRLKVGRLDFAVFPNVNPYENVRDNAVQFQPKVTIFLSVENAEGVNTPFKFDFQTSISSRVYSKKV